MKINTKATGIELTSAIASYVEKRIRSLEKFLDPDADVTALVEVGKTTRHHKSGDVFRAEVHLVGSGLDIYAVSETGDLYASIDAVKDEVSHNMLQLKGKRQTLARKGAEMMKYAMKGLYDGTTKGFSWGKDRFKNWRNKEDELS